MNNRSRSTFPFVVCLTALTTWPAIAAAQTHRPVIYYSDLESGPNTGGENNQGALVTIYGEHFGSSPKPATAAHTPDRIPILGPATPSKMAASTRI
jgi:hypothetical protein